jgi:hypothetical protein
VPRGYLGPLQRFRATLAPQSYSGVSRSLRATPKARANFGAYLSLRIILALLGHSETSGSFGVNLTPQSHFATSEPLRRLEVTHRRLVFTWGHSESLHGSGSLYRVYRFFLTERHLTKTSFDRTPFDRKAI